MKLYTLLIIFILLILAGCLLYQSNRISELEKKNSIMANALKELQDNDRTAFGYSQSTIESLSKCLFDPSCDKSEKMKSTHELQKEIVELQSKKEKIYDDL